MCAQSDLEKLHNQVIPSVEKFTKVMMQLEEDMNTNQQIIMRFDEVLTQKASKISLQKLEHDLENYVTVVAFKAHNKEWVVLIVLLRITYLIIDMSQFMAT